MLTNRLTTLFHSTIEKQIYYFPQFANAVANTNAGTKNYQNVLSLVGILLRYIANLAMRLG